MSRASKKRRAKRRGMAQVIRVHLEAQAKLAADAVVLATRQALLEQAAERERQAGLLHVARMRVIFDTVLGDLNRPALALVGGRTVVFVGDSPRVQAARVAIEARQASKRDEP